MSTFEQAIPVLINDEGGGYVEDDHGRGPSRWGVTLLTAQEIHPDWTAKDIFNLTRAGAVEFYREWLWEGKHLGRIGDQQLATKVFDIAANTGPGTAIEILQSAVGAIPDGIIGDQTAFLVTEEPPLVVLANFRARGKEYYDHVVAKHPQWAGDEPGWIARLNA